MASINERKAFRLSVIFILLIAVIACMIISLIWGSTPVSLAEIWRTLWADELTDTASQIIWNIRLPRNIVAALVGACLAVSGAILQAVMKNPLADPQIVGVSSGAGLAGVIVLILFPGYDYIVPLVAFLGAMGAALMVYALAWKNGVRPSRIILAGVAVAAFLGSGISALLVFYGDRVQGAQEQPGHGQQKCEGHCRTAGDYPAAGGVKATANHPGLDCIWGQGQSRWSAFWQRGVDRYGRKDRWTRGKAGRIAGGGKEKEKRAGVPGNHGLFRHAASGRGPA